ncbi:MULTISPECIES: pyridoxamine 5'-phosphate oxidase family protein [Microbacterium]|uniref:Pyridoxamine 5'-phosphate oxidase family protein n=1 Tax=Microbacterium schleiferi TaxID=69362 RepID=A0ABU7V9T5_9MICO|tara:strand:+ start:451 stop:891 length:441 start_codon:yes stop_codon:yes gene_type:complete
MEEMMDDVVATLSDAECWQLLAGEELGRLVTRVGDVLDIFPVNYVVDRDTVVFRTAAGSKLVELTVNDEVLFEVDHYTDAAAWSVIIRGRAQRLATEEDVEAADELPLRPWLPTLKYHYVRVSAETMSGRSFRRGPEPDRYGIADY